MSKNLSQALKEMAKVTKQAGKRAEMIKDLVPSGDPSQMVSLIKVFEWLSRIHQGDQGIKGDTPVKGVDYFTLKEAEIFLKMATPVKNRDYRDGIDGQDGADGKPGRNGVDGKNGLDGESGRDGVANLNEVREMANASVSKHEKDFDHTSLHDPRMLGEFELEKEIKDGDLLQVRGKKIVGVKLPDLQGYVRGYVSQQGVSNIRSFSVTASRELEAMGLYVIDATAGNITITVPSAAGRENYWFELIRIDGTANTVTIVPTGSETMSGMTDYIMQQWTDVKLFAYASNYLLRGAN